MLGHKSSAALAMLSIWGATAPDLRSRHPREVKVLGDCPCGGKYYETPVSGKPRCGWCKKLMPKGMKVEEDHDTENDT